MLITLLDLEREPVRFDLKFSPGSIDYGDEATQISDLAVTGEAEVLHEHRGPREVVQDIRARAKWAGTFEAPCARCLDPVKHELAGSSTCCFGRWVSMRVHRNGSWGRRKRKSVIIRKAVWYWKMFCGSRCC
jgi:hypothetical protein